MRAYLRSAREGRSRAEDDDAGNSELARLARSRGRGSGHLSVGGELVGPYKHGLIGPKGLANRLIEPRA